MIIVKFYFQRTMSDNNISAENRFLAVKLTVPLQLKKFLAVM